MIVFRRVDHDKSDPHNALGYVQSVIQDMYILGYVQFVIENEVARILGFACVLDFSTHGTGLHKMGIRFSHLQKKF